MMDETIDANAAPGAEPQPNTMRQTYRPLTDDDKFIMENIKAGGQNFWSYIDGLGDSRELALAKTKIEEAVMWAVKHVTA